MPLGFLPPGALSKQIRGGRVRRERARSRAFTCSDSGGVGEPATEAQIAVHTPWGHGSDPDCSPQRRVHQEQRGGRAHRGGCESHGAFGPRPTLTTPLNTLAQRAAPRPFRSLAPAAASPVLETAASAVSRRGGGGPPFSAVRRYTHCNLRNKSAHIFWFLLKSDKRNTLGSHQGKQGPISNY